jgi:hypothetical protein
MRSTSGTRVFGRFLSGLALVGLLGGAVALGGCIHDHGWHRGYNGHDDHHRDRDRDRDHDGDHGGDHGHHD